MENPNLKNNGEIKVPIGFRFRPTDEEILVHYLKRKAFSLPLNSSIIPELDVFQSNPSNLPGDVKEKRHFFSKRRKDGSSRGNIKFVRNGTGFWKENTKKRKLIVSSESNQIIGFKKSLLFYQRETLVLSKTNWVLHEYSLLAIQAASNLTQKMVMELDDWVVHKVFEKERRVKRNKFISEQYEKTDETVEEHFDLGPEQEEQPSWPCSSGITEVSFDETTE